MSNKTEIHVDSEVPLVRITREFDAPPEKVFRAHTDPALIVQWLGPRDLAMEVERYDCHREGYEHDDRERLSCSDVAGIPGADQHAVEGEDPAGEAGGGATGR